MLYFSEDGKTVQVETYSPVRNQYYMTDNQYSFTIDVVGAQAPAVTDTPAVTDVPADPGTPVKTADTAVYFLAAALIAVLGCAVVFRKVNEK